jgi:hypothetical protein
MAKADAKNTAAAQRSKCRSPKLVVLGEARYLDAGELGGRSDFESLALRREWKERRYQRLIDKYYRTALAERQWWKLRDIADECARRPGTATVGNKKRDSILRFLCDAIYRGEFRDGKGRMQVAYLHFSPLASIRLSLNGLEKPDDLLKLVKYLWARRKECIECLSRNNIEIPKMWRPSELIGDMPSTPNDSRPTSPATDHHDRPSAKPPPRWKFRDERPQGRESNYAFIIMNRVWPEGPPLSMSIPKIMEEMTKYEDMNPNTKHRGGFSSSTVRRLLKH